MTKINPFKPNSPVPVAMFAGRLKEIETMEKGLFQTKNKNPQNFLITGERGIGKSSLLSLIKPTATGHIKSPDYDRFNFIAIDIVISDRTDLVTLIKLINKNIERSIGKIESIRKFLSDTWSFVQRIRVMDSGIEKNEEMDNTDILINDFAWSLAETCKRITNPEKGEEAKDGIIFFLDETDNASPSLHIGYFLKVVMELLQKHDCNNIMFMVAGLPDVIDKLSKSHESSLRLFIPLNILELNPKDRYYVVQKGLDEGNKINEAKTTITEQANRQISNLSEGYPHFIQQFAYSAFEHNSDGEISEDDVLDGAFCEGGTIDCLGTRYYASAFHEQIKSDEYRQVLAIMAENMNSWIKKCDIRSKFSGAEQTLNNALQALTNRKIILKNSSKVGEYRLQQKGFALWIKLFGNRRK